MFIHSRAREEGRGDRKFSYCIERQVNVNSAMKGGGIPGTKEWVYESEISMNLFSILLFSIRIRRG